MKIADLKKLHQKRYREAFGFFLVEGEHPVLELQRAALSDPQLKACELYVTGAHRDWPSSFATHVISAAQMTQIADTKTPQGIVALVPLLKPTVPRTAERGIYLHEIQDPGNLGTILRTLGWFGSFRCLLSAGSVDPYNPKVVRASMGAIFHVPIELDVDLPTLRERYARIACLDLRGASVCDPSFDGFDCYVFGNEARGVPHDSLVSIGARSYTIAGSGVLESLNLAAAVSMCTYELNRRSV
jgi:RNA methyltransferase, TrmH family